MDASRTNKKGLVDGLCWLAEKLKSLCNKVEAVPGKGPEVFAIVLYAVAHLLMAIVHEPWFDEALAWQIARVAPLGDILFQIPHYEGHPPLWHLILLPFAKLGAPYELSLSIVSLIFAGAAVGLLIWKAPFPRLIRLLVPFTYFFFYQYGVVSRPYCVMMLAFVLLAICYRRRNEKPGRYVLSLALLCLTSAYGILMAGGLALVWVWEIWHFQNIGKFLGSFAKDRRIWWLTGLLVLAILLILEIMPREDTYAAGVLSGTDGFVNRLIFTVLAIPAEVSITSIYKHYTYLQGVNLSLSSMLPACIVGILIWGIGIVYGLRKKTLGILVIPYMAFAGFSAAVYIYPHHFGVAALYAVFWFWISRETEHTGKNAVRANLSAEDRRTLASGLTLFGAAVILVSGYWSADSCVTDISVAYAAGRYEAQFIKENGLDRYTIMNGWNVYKDGEGEIVGYDTNHGHCVDNVAVYFDRNIFYTFNDGRDDLNYTTHRVATEEENETRIAMWRENPPDVIYMYPELEMVYDEDELSVDDYALVFTKDTGVIWKGESYGTCSGIYVRKELAEELGLEELDGLAYHGWSTTSDEK